MDDRHFDALTRAMATPGPRRRLLGAVAALPLLGAMLAPPTAEEAKGKRKKRKKRKKPCQAETAAQTCAGTCGSVTNNCLQTVNCGSCACTPACGVCFTCQERSGAPGVCVPKASGTPCGSATCRDGTVTRVTCDGAGACASASVSCAPYAGCDGDACATNCSSDPDCVGTSWCNASGKCVGDLPIGATCSHDGQCIGGFCSGGRCCDSGCDEPCVACNLPGHEGSCSPIPNGTSCGSGAECVHGGCYTITSDVCSNCPGSCDYCAGSVDGTGNYLCVNATVEPCSTNADCPLAWVCRAGSQCAMPC